MGSISRCMTCRRRHHHALRPNPSAHPSAYCPLAPASHVSLPSLPSASDVISLSMRPASGVRMSRYVLSTSAERHKHPRRRAYASSPTQQTLDTSISSHTGTVRRVGPGWVLILARFASSAAAAALGAPPPLNVPCLSLARVSSLSFSAAISHARLPCHHSADDPRPCKKPSPRASSTGTQICRNLSCSSTHDVRQESRWNKSKERRGHPELSEGQRSTPASTLNDEQDAHGGALCACARGLWRAGSLAGCHLR
ncbi:hypothetical protein L226DRAFT_91522 [Lentinus tigrinus ALCF2SS1-7]|uniref:uncharacterized protein n=1 Tax=Lentinus tigrinus ALCF2SS1-7 TaxID=1328758 RepID=UPI00116605F1|nr:hypothetical protein L226DRAFT_91522 [Lentinus tigrinus ALCF2SS1-7]